MDGGEIARESGKERLDLSKFLTPKRVQEILPSILSLVKQLHELSVTHGDMNPGNILVTHHGSLLLGDFGFTRRFIKRRAILWKLW